MERSEAQKLCDDSPYSLDGDGIEWIIRTNQQILELVEKAIQWGRDLESAEYYDHR